MLIQLPAIVPIGGPFNATQTVWDGAEASVEIGVCAMDPNRPPGCVSQLVGIGGIQEALSTGFGKVFFLALFLLWLLCPSPWSAEAICISLFYIGKFERENILH